MRSSSGITTVSGECESLVVDVSSKCESLVVDASSDGMICGVVVVVVVVLLADECRRGST